MSSNPFSDMLSSRTVNARYEPTPVGKYHAKLSSYSWEESKSSHAAGLCFEYTMKGDDGKEKTMRETFWLLGKDGNLPEKGKDFSFLKAKNRLLTLGLTENEIRKMDWPSKASPISKTLNKAMVNALALIVEVGDQKPQEGDTQQFTMIKKVTSHIDNVPKKSSNKRAKKEAPSVKMEEFSDHESVVGASSSAGSSASESEDITVEQKEKPKRKRGGKR